MKRLHWTGQAAPMLDKPSLLQVGRVALGVYGGNTAVGAKKNEDAALIWESDNWTFAAILDAHGTSDSALLVLDLLENHRDDLQAALAQPVADAFVQLEKQLVTALSSPAFLAACRELNGETALLCCATKGAYLWWFSVGDGVAYLFHPDLTRLGQFALNQRQFFEWVGKVGGFDQRPFTYSSGVRALRRGWHDVVLVTDGLLEFGTRPFEDPRQLAQALGVGIEEPPRLLDVLRHVHAARGRDSATLIHWRVRNDGDAPLPSA